MNYREFVRRAVTLVLIVALVVVLVLGINRIIPLLVMAFTAWVLAVTLEVPVRFLQRLKIGRIPAVLIVILVLLLLGVGFIALVLPPSVRQAQDLLADLPDELREGVRNYMRFRAGNELARQVLPPIDIRLVDAILSGQPEEPGAEESGPPIVVDVARLIETALPVLGTIGSLVASALANLFLIALIALLLLLEPVVYYRAIISLVPRQSEGRALQIINMIRQNVVRWLGAMLISMGITTVLFLIVLGVILRLPNALVLSLLAGLGTFVPTFGPTIALIPIAVVAAADGVKKLILTVILYAAVGAFQDRVITPAIMKTELDIPAAALVVTQLILAIEIGPLGLLLAVPILAIVITLVRELLIFDVLKKRDGLAEVVIGPDGTLTLVEPGWVDGAKGADETAPPPEPETKEQPVSAE